MAVMLTLRPAVAQELTSSLLPDSVAEQLVGFHNMETTTRLQGDARIGPGTTMSGGIAVLGGSLTVEGTVEGDVVVINGDLVVLPGGSITGDATVAGGAATVTGTVAGGVRVYREPLRYRVVDGAIVYVPPDLDEGLSAGRDFAFGRTELRVSSYGAYNRAEGLPIGVGPRVRFGGTHPVSALALLILRTAVPGDDLDSRRLGYDVRVEQLVAPALGLTLGARLLSVITPIESWGITDRESALAAFILRTDYRDHYQRQGWSAYASLVRPGTPWSLGLEYLDEEHGRAPIANPVVLLDARPGWRPEPSIAVGSLRSVAASLRYDTRNEERDPSAGWLIDVAVEQALGGAMVNPGSFDQETGTTVSRVANSSFMTGRVDVRRYARLSPYARIGLRVIAAGSVDGASLPPQRQVALGGEGSLPGYRLFEFDCGARSNTVTVGGETFHPYYGCDRMAVVQLEYQAGFPFARRVSEALGLGPSLGYLARWVAFFDAGRAWNEPGSRDGRFGGNDDFSADAGLGIRLGPLGGYWTVPLSGHGQGFHMFVRIAPRL
ncbi:MAG: BamA/TamA family outer membrane protein [Gemmatimonadetes bacterium]|nr:BamA/TamA family outer membrane protein [Gemmatimonadota bacterium]